MSVALELVSKYINLVECALEQPSIPQGKHHYLPHLRAVPEVAELYHALYWLYDTVTESVDFREPVNAVAIGLHNYFRVVTRPMSLRDVLDRIAKGEYSTADQVLDDVEQIWKNCSLYNGADSDFTRRAYQCKRTLYDEIANRKDNRIASQEAQDHVAQLIESANDEEFNNKVLDILSLIAPHIVKDGEVDLTQMTVKVTKEIQAAYQAHVAGGVKRGRSL